MAWPLILATLYDAAANAVGTVASTIGSAAESAGGALGLGGGAGGTASAADLGVGVGVATAAPGLSGAGAASLAPALPGAGASAFALPGLGSQIASALGPLGQLATTGNVTPLIRQGLDAVNAPQGLQDLFAKLKFSVSGGGGGGAQNAPPPPPGSPFKFQKNTVRSVFDNRGGY